MPPRLRPLISIRKAHLSKYRLVPVFDQLAAGAIVLGLVVFMQLVADFIVSMVDVVLMFDQIGSTPAPKESLVM